MVIPVLELQLLSGLRLEMGLVGVQQTLLMDRG